MSVPDASVYPPRVRLSVAALFLQLSYDTVRRWADRGKLDARNLEPGGVRYVAVAELLLVSERLGTAPNWAALEDAL